MENFFLHTHLRLINFSLLLARGWRLVLLPNGLFPFHIFSHNKQQQQPRFSWLSALTFHTFSRQSIFRSARVQSPSERLFLGFVIPPLAGAQPHATNIGTAF